MSDPNEFKGPEGYTFTIYESDVRPGVIVRSPGAPLDHGQWIPAGELDAFVTWVRTTNRKRMIEAALAVRPPVLFSAEPPPQGGNYSNRLPDGWLPGTPVNAPGDDAPTLRGRSLDEVCPACKAGVGDDAYQDGYQQGWGDALER